MVNAQYVGISVSNWRWDKWQKRILDHDGNIAIRCGRQVGKSEVVSAKAAKFALENPGTTTLIIAAAQRQSSLLFEKVRANFDRLEDLGQEIYSEEPTLTRAKLKNGSRVYSLPAGRSGHFIRGFTLDLLIADEAAFIPDIVWNAVIPMIAVSRKKRGQGFIILLSTPFGKGGYFYDAFNDADYLHIHQSSEDCKRIPKDFLRKEKLRLTKAEYAQEYLGEFTDEWNQLFPTKLIKSCMTFMDWSLTTDRKAGAGYYLGIDVARYGGHENAFAFVENHNNKIKCVKVSTTERVSTTDTVGRAEHYDSLWKFNRIGVDDSGVGGGVTDQLQDKLGRRRVIALNNATKRIQIQGEERKRGIFKEDLYSNLLKLMEVGKIELINDLKLLKSLKSIIYEYGETPGTRKIKIYGNYSHITEALVRAVWCATKEKGLRLYIY
jgi:hypothetical protein